MSQKDSPPKIRIKTFLNKNVFSTKFPCLHIVTTLFLFISRNDDIGNRNDQIVFQDMPYSFIGWLNAHKAITQRYKIGVALKFTFECITS